MIEVIFYSTEREKNGVFIFIEIIFILMKFKVFIFRAHYFCLFIPFSCIQ